MNVWVRKTRKKAICFYCSKEIETGTYQIVCQYFMKLKSGKVWTKKMLFHAEPNCWLNRAIAELESRPTIERRGRVANSISDPVKEKRNKILRRRASIVQRINIEMEGAGNLPGRQRPEKLAHLLEMLENLKMEIEPLGGVPESWN